MYAHTASSLSPAHYLASLQLLFNMLFASNKFETKYVLVIGGLGYIGSHTTLELLKNGFNVVLVDNLSNCYESALRTIKELAEQYCLDVGRKMPVVHFHKLDYQSLEMAGVLDLYDAPPVPQETNAALPVTNRSRITSVIHFAGYKAVTESINNPLAYYANNTCGLVYLLRLLEDHSIYRFVFSSSATVYSAKTNMGTPLREELVFHGSEADDSTIVPMTKCSLASPYARSKYFSEAILFDVAESNPRWTITALRYFNPVGCHTSGLLRELPRCCPSNLFPLMVQVLTGKLPHLDIFGSDWPTRDGTAVRDFVHVVDVARGHVVALKSPRKPGFEAFNLGSGRGTTVLEAVASMELASGRVIPVNWTGRRCGDVAMCVAATEKSEMELNWRPQECIVQCAKDVWNSVARQRVENEYNL